MYSLQETSYTFSPSSYEFFYSVVTTRKTCEKKTDLWE